MMLLVVLLHLQNSDFLVADLCYVLFHLSVCNSTYMSCFTVLIN